MAGENAVQRREIEAVRRLCVRRDRKLDLVQLAHVVPNLGNILGPLVRGLTDERDELADDVQ